MHLGCKYYCFGHSRPTEDASTSFLFDRLKSKDGDGELASLF